MKNHLRNNINFWKILSVYNAYDPLNRLPNISAIDEYEDKVEILLKKINSKKVTKNQINQIHREIFEAKLDEGLLLLLRDEIYNLIPEKFVNKNNKRTSTTSVIDAAEKINQNSQKKINYLKSTGDFKSFKLNNKRIILQKSFFILEIIKNFRKGRRKNL